jgi:uncharacterized protein (DUF736 family)
MAYETKAGSGSLFPNDRKQKETHPDWKGRIKWHNGTEAWLSAWEKETKDGRKFLSIQVGEYITPQTTEHEQAKANGYQKDTFVQANSLDSEIPF